MRGLTKLTCLLALAGSAAALHAQGVTADVTAPAAAPGPSNTMSVADMQSAMTKLDVQMQDDNRALLHFQEIARKQKDVIKLNCVNDRLVLVKAQLNNADATKVQLTAALAKSGDERFALYQDLSTTANTIKTLRAEADSCIGAPDLMRQESGVTVEHPDIPDDPTKVDPFGQDKTEIEPPAYASPFN